MKTEEAGAQFGSGLYVGRFMIGAAYLPSYNLAQSPTIFAFRSGKSRSGARGAPRYRVLLGFLTVSR